MFHYEMNYYNLIFTKLHSNIEYYNLKKNIWIDYHLFLSRIEQEYVIQMRSRPGIIVSTKKKKLLVQCEFIGLKSQQKRLQHEETQRLLID